MFVKEMFHSVLNSKFDDVTPIEGACCDKPIPQGCYIGAWLCVCRKALALDLV